MKIVEEVVNFGGKEFILTNQRALFWKEKSMLILSDFHIGKAAHFRKNGIALPTQIQTKDLNRLEKLILHFEPIEILVVGDLLHAGANLEVNQFTDWMQNKSEITFHLIKGNHDRFSDAKYLELGIHTVCNYKEIDGIYFSHEPIDSKNFVISGHIHPGISLKLPTKKHMKFPCFVVTENQLILPAFSEFTGHDTHNLPKNADFYVFYDSGISKFQF